jgi:prohibitin 2
MLFVFIFILLLIAPFALNVLYPNGPKIPPIYISIVLAGSWLFANSITVVTGGSVGVQVTFGSINPVALTEGLHLVNPLSNITTISARMTASKLENASGGSKDLQQVHTDIVVNYRLRGERAAHIYKEFGFDLRDSLIMPMLSESFKSVTARHTSEELITKRDEVSSEIKAEFEGKLNKYDISVNDVSLVNFGFSTAYQTAIEEKVIATQSKLKAEQDLSRIKVEAEQAIAKAEGNAKAIKIQVEAINTQGGASYVELKKVEKWDGKLPTTIAGQVTPFLNIGK